MHTSPLPKIAVIYLSFHCEPYLEDLIPALENVTYPKDRWAFFVVDNPHPTHGHSITALSHELLPKEGKTLPRIVLLPQEKNLGFSGGNNAGIAQAISEGYEYIYLLNNDALPEPGFLEPLVEALEQDRSIGCAQSFITLYPKKDLINSSGNAYHFLGFGYCNDYQKSTEKFLATHHHPYTIHYASGAGVLLRADLLQKHGYWDEDFWMYHEDLEYSLRLFMLGYRIVCVPSSQIGHKYEFSRSISKFMYMERNRYAVLLLTYKLPTLILLLPGLLSIEFVMLFFAWRGGWLLQKIQAYQAWFSPSMWQTWLTKRVHVQATRTRSDRELITSVTTGKILFQEREASRPSVRYLANPLFSAYRAILSAIIWW